MTKAEIVADFRKQEKWERAMAASYMAPYKTTAAAPSAAIEENYMHRQVADTYDYCARMLEELE